MPLDNSLESQLLTAQIARHEGCVLHAYEDSEGFLTIGFGHLIDQRRGGGISEDIAKLLLWQDAQIARDAVLRRWPWMTGLNPVRLRAVVDMAFNLGIEGLAKFEKMLAALEREDYHAAADHALDSKWATQVGKRAEFVAEQIRTGKDMVA